ncbi:MAG: endo alpha-1,4 polygalactosaminidase [Myxococcales bacterium]|nr:endo alpha-1,4 polygalactosaminidase [Myxococcales bacterium]
MVGGAEVAERALMRSSVLAWLTVLGLASASCTPEADQPSREPGSDHTQAATSPYVPEPGTTWQWQLSGKIDTSVDVTVYDVDLFETSDEVLTELRDGGRKIVCYFSAGSYEPGRPDSADFPKSVRGKELDGWPGERWLDVRDDAVREIMTARLDLAKKRGCDGVEPDNVDGFENDSGFDLSSDDQVDYNRFLAEEAHARGLSVGLKNDIGQLEELVDDFDWALNEECFTYEECGAYEATFIAGGKAVFHAEYVEEDRLEEVCDKTRPLGLSTLIKRLDLDAWYAACPE